MLFKYLENDNAEAKSQVNALEEPHVHILISQKLAKMFGIDPRKLAPCPEEVKPENTFLASTFSFGDENETILLARNLAMNSTYMVDI
ncbi:hypothetical protein [Enterococcus mediterraneensis]|uniref:hypothetical protein n=1 Tax=Enterococcus mediterraneensis TaxID=2364791 RepID=UPI000F06D187|nr:hypothetical protein [Enterococcus mediterraneensis]